MLSGKPLVEFRAFRREEGGVIREKKRILPFLPPPLRKALYSGKLTFRYST